VYQPCILIAGLRERGARCRGSMDGGGRRARVAGAGQVGDQMNRWLRIALAGSLAAWACGAARGQEPHGHPPEHAQLHKEFYSRLQRPDVPPETSALQKSCCDNRDCRPVRARFDGVRWEYLGTHGWERVPAGKILDVRSPDTRAHACVSLYTLRLRCFVKPDFGM
jgi:hypothetical protein